MAHVLSGDGEGGIVIALSLEDRARIADALDEVVVTPGGDEDGTALWRLIRPLSHAQDGPCGTDPCPVHPCAPASVSAP